MTLRQLQAAHKLGEERHPYHERGLVPSRLTIQIRTSEALTLMRVKVEEDLALAGTSSTQRVQKMVKGFQSTLAHYAVLSAENQWLMEQNNEKTSRASVRSTVIGGPKVMTYDDIIERQQLRETAERRNSGVTKRRKGGHQPA